MHQRLKRDNNIHCTLYIVKLIRAVCEKSVKIWLMKGYYLVLIVTMLQNGFIHRRHSLQSIKCQCNKFHGICWAWKAALYGIKHLMKISSIFGNYIVNGILCQYQRKIPRHQIQSAKFSACTTFVAYENDNSRNMYIITNIACLWIECG